MCLSLPAGLVSTWGAPLLARLGEKGRWRGWCPGGRRGAFRRAEPARRLPRPRLSRVSRRALGAWGLPSGGSGPWGPGTGPAQAPAGRPSSDTGAPVPSQRHPPQGQRPPQCLQGRSVTSVSQLAGVRGPRGAGSPGSSPDGLRLGPDGTPVRPGVEALPRLPPGTRRVLSAVLCLSRAPRCCLRLRTQVGGAW